MRHALIDNSTLTAVQRMMGAIPVEYDRTVVDGDILTQEYFVQTLLFYDHVVCIDDYKDSWRASRRTAFPYVAHYNPSRNHAEIIAARAAEVLETVSATVTAGDFTDADFKSFFDLLGMNVLLRWEMNSSEYFLYQRMLESAGGVSLDRYSQLASQIYQQAYGHPGDQASLNIHLRDARGREVIGDYQVAGGASSSAKGELSQQLKVFFAGLNWLASRTIEYTLWAKGLRADLILHPIRHAFQINMMRNRNPECGRAFQAIIPHMADAAHRTMAKVATPDAPGLLLQNLPMFSLWLLDKTGDPAKLPDAARELGQTSAFVGLRRKLSELDEVYEQGEVARFRTAVNSLRAAIDSESQALLRIYGVDAGQGVSTAPVLTAYNFTTLASGLPTIPVLTQAFESIGWIADRMPRFGPRGLYRSLVRDLANVAQLGSYHERLTAAVDFGQRATRLTQKAESQKYRYARSFWKMPM